ncbi:MAG TPA: hypothetical protein DF699_02320, partial [Phycisphaerales bacterium]|nr:hypothetical protein [Phycisphaerales bacterium]
VLSGELDPGVVTLPIEHPRSDELMVVKEISDELMLIVPEDHPLHGRKTFRWQELEGEAVIAFEAGSAVRKIIDQGAAAHGVNLEVVMELRSIESIVQMVRADIGVGFVSKHGLPPSMGVRCKDGGLTRTLGVVRARDRIQSHASRTFFEALEATRS